jgi:DDE superfamily endonuclease
MDAGYGNNSNLRADIAALGLTYVVGILSNTTVWASGTGPLPAKKWSGRGRPPKRLQRNAEHWPISVKELARGLPKRAWRTIEWREGSAELLSSRFARVRVRAAHRDDQRSECQPEEWLLIEWPEGEKEPTKYWLSTLPLRASLSGVWSTSPSCAGASSATTRSSSRRWGSAISKAADGEASITMPHYVLRLTVSWSPSGRRFPPQDLVPPRYSRCLQYPTVTDLEAPPLRPERHIPNSIATMRRRLFVALVKTLSRCPCCAAPTTPRARPRALMTQ